MRPAFHLEFSSANSAPDSAGENPKSAAGTLRWAWTGRGRADSASTGRTCWWPVRKTRAVTLFTIFVVPTVVVIFPKTYKLFSSDQSRSHVWNLDIVARSWGSCGRSILPGRIKASVSSSAKEQARNLQQRVESGRPVTRRGTFGSFMQNRDAAGKTWPGSSSRPDPVIGSFRALGAQMQRNRRPLIASERTLHFN